MCRHSDTSQKPYKYRNITFFNIATFHYSIHNQHAIIKLSAKKDKAFITPVEKDCRILVNGGPITAETPLEHNDRIVVGSTHIWIFQNPLEKGIDKKQYPPITYDYAQEEIAAKAGISIQSGDSADVALLHEDLIGNLVFEN